MIGDDGELIARRPGRPKQIVDRPDPTPHELDEHAHYVGLWRRFYGRTGIDRVHAAAILAHRRQLDVQGIEIGARIADLEALIVGLGYADTIAPLVAARARRLAPTVPVPDDQEVAAA